MKKMRQCKTCQLQSKISRGLWGQTKNKRDNLNQAQLLCTTHLISHQRIQRRFVGPLKIHNKSSSSLLSSQKQLHNSISRLAVYDTAPQSRLGNVVKPYQVDITNLFLFTNRPPPTDLFRFSEIESKSFHGDQRQIVNGRGYKVTHSLLAGIIFPRCPMLQNEGNKRSCSRVTLNSWTQPSFGKRRYAFSGCNF